MSIFNLFKKEDKRPNFIFDNNTGRLLTQSKNTKTAAKTKTTSKVKNKKHFNPKSAVHSTKSQNKNLRSTKFINNTINKADKNITTPQNVPWGRTLSTYDNNTTGKKTGSTKERPVVVIDNNNKNDLAVVSLTKTNGIDRTPLDTYQDGKSYYKHYVEIEDDSGNPIRVNDKFRANHKNMDIPLKDIDLIRDKVLNHSRQSSENRKKIESLKKR